MTTISNANIKPGMTIKVSTFYGWCKVLEVTGSTAKMIEIKIAVERFTHPVVTTKNLKFNSQIK